MVAAKKTPAKKTVKAPEVKTIEQLRDDLVKALQDLTDSRRSHAQGELAKTVTGIVTSDVADKTITVSVTSRETHPIYGKQYSVTRKYAAHDEKNEAKIGDKVVISETRPVSKRKSFKLDQVIEKSRGSIELKENEVA
jgi:small subunit ribosomal protein S17